MFVATFAGMSDYYLINKPYGMLSQFTREAGHHRVLGELGDFPRDVYPVGRLDRDSEGLLIMTNDRRLNDALLNPGHGHRRTYRVLVEGVPGDKDLSKLAGGPVFRAKGKTVHPKSLKVKRLPLAIVDGISERDPPVRKRISVTDTWLELTLTEGKNRQVRRMCAAVGFPVLRLIRHSIEQISLDELTGREAIQIEGRRLMDKLRVKF